MIIHTENLSKAYGQRDAVRGVNLAVPAGSAYALIGANGAGAIWRDAYFRLGFFGTGQRFDNTGDARVPYNMVEMFVPQDHFTRHVTLPKLQLP